MGEIKPHKRVNDIFLGPLERPALLRSVLSSLLEWRAQLGMPEFLYAWEERLAFRGEWVYAISGGESGKPQARQGQVLGLDAGGRLRLCDSNGEMFALQVGEVQLRPLEG